MPQSEELALTIARWFLDAGTASFNSPEDVRMIVSHEFGDNLKEEVAAEIIAILTADEERRDV